MIKKKIITPFKIKKEETAVNQIELNSIIENSDT